VIRAGDCREVMLDMLLDGERFDAVVTDPPYDLTSTVERFGKPGAAPAKDATFARMSKGFMGKTWDGTGVAFDPDTWRAVSDVLRPGAHLLAFGGSRTYHRMACAIEDAGFEIRDTMLWIYGTGFPKSLDVSKAIDKAAGAVREVVGPRMRPDGKAMLAARGGDESRSDGWDRPWRDDPEAVARNGMHTAPATPEAAQWQGWGTALKPAFEPIIVARKPLDRKTVAANVLAHGTGALNIDACRVPLAEDDKLQDGVQHAAHALDDTGAWGFKAVDRAAGLGRFPANVLHDGSDEVEAAFAEYGEKTSGTFDGNRKADKFRNTYGAFTGAAGERAYTGNTGTASRFFYSAKASKSDRAESRHPTVKPLALMRYLCKLVTPPGGTVLDPFAGSGTTLQAALECGFKAVGIEREPEYIADIERRLMTYYTG
jgi:site-specific DNA-methyltransferase (adenine-specific)